ncbi:hypothetical protein GCM10010433_40290 [Streptomyces pulveraceus]
MKQPTPAEPAEPAEPAAQSIHRGTSTARHGGVSKHRAGAFMAHRHGRPEDTLPPSNEPITELARVAALTYPKVEMPYRA